MSEACDISTTVSRSTEESWGSFPLDFTYITEWKEMFWETVPHFLITSHQCCSLKHYHKLLNKDFKLKFTLENLHNEAKRFFNFFSELGECPTNAGVSSEHHQWGARPRPRVTWGVTGKSLRYSLCSKAYISLPLPQSFRDLQGLHTEWRTSLKIYKFISWCEELAEKQKLLKTNITDYNWIWYIHKANVYNCYEIEFVTGLQGTLACWQLYYK